MPRPISPQTMPETGIITSSGALIRLYITIAV